MKRWALLALLFIGGKVSANEFVLKDLGAGMYSYPSASEIPDNAAAYIQNFYTDIQPLAMERNGYVRRDNTALGGTAAVSVLLEFLDNSGNDWVISYSSRTFYKNTIGQTPTAFGPITTTSNLPSCAVNLGKLWCVDGVDSLWYFDGTSTAAVAGAPLGRIIVPWRTRLSIGDINGSQSTVRMSADGDGTTWTVGSNATDPFNIQFGGANDGQYIRCMWGSYADTLIIGRKYDLWGVNGFSQADYQTRNLSSEVGCIEQGSMREYDGSLLFLSARGMEAMTGATIQAISDPIRDLTDILVRNTSNQRSNTQTSQSDWQAGTVATDQTTTSSPGDLAQKTSDYAWTSGTDWSTGAFTNAIYVDTVSTSGRIQLNFPDTFASFRDGTGGTPPVWSKYESGTITGSVSAGGTLDFADAGTQLGRENVHTVNTFPDWRPGTTWYFTIQSFPTDSGSLSALYMTLRTSLATSPANPDNTGMVFQFLSTTTSRCHLANVTITGRSGGTSSAVGFAVPATVQVYLSTTTYAVTINDVLASSGTHTASVQSDYLYLGYLKGSAGAGTLSLDNFGISPEQTVFTSAGLDTGIISPIWGTFTTTSANNGGTATFQGQTTATALDSCPCSYGSLTTLTSGSVPSLSTQRSVRVVATIGVTASSYPVTSPTVDDFRLNAGSSGTFTSQLITIGSLISSWGPVTISDVKTADASITYQFGSTTTASVAAITNWATIVNGGVPTAATNPYAAFKAVPTVNSGTGTAKISDFQTTWNEGATTPSPVSTVYDRRYWISFTTSAVSAPTQDTVAVYQRNHTWTIFKGLNAASFTLWRDNLYFGNSNATGLVYKFDVGNSDDSSSITSEIITKSYDLTVSNHEKDLRNLYVNYLGNATFSGSFALTYDLDRSGNSFSLGSANMSEGTGQVSAKFPFTLSNPVQGREMQFTLLKTGTGDRLKLYDIRGIYSLKEER